MNAKLHLIFTILFTLGLQMVKCQIGDSTATGQLSSNTTDGRGAKCKISIYFTFNSFEVVEPSLSVWPHTTVEIELCTGVVHILRNAFFGVSLLCNG